MPPSALQRVLNFLYFHSVRHLWFVDLDRDTLASLRVVLAW